MRESQWRDRLAERSMQLRDQHESICDVLVGLGSDLDLRLPMDE